jgi:hypothetical protein
MSRVKILHLLQSGCLTGIGLMMPGLLMGSVLAGLLARRISSSPSNDLDEPVFRKEALPDSSFSSSLKLDTEH